MFSHFPINDNLSTLELNPVFTEKKKKQDFWVWLRSFSVYTSMLLQFAEVSTLFYKLIFVAISALQGL